MFYRSLNYANLVPSIYLRKAPVQLRKQRIAEQVFVRLTKKCQKISNIGRLIIIKVNFCQLLSFVGLLKIVDVRNFFIFGNLTFMGNLSVRKSAISGKN